MTRWQYDAELGRDVQIDDADPPPPLSDEQRRARVAERLAQVGGDVIWADDADAVATGLAFEAIQDERDNAQRLIDDAEGVE
jgi:hypothetical protein